MSTIPYKDLTGSTKAAQRLFGFDIVSEIGKGAASTIYAVSDPKTGQVYALKHVVRKTDREQRFIEQVQNEFEVGKACKHPVLRKMVDLKTVKKFFGPITEVGLLMELIDGVPYDEKGITDLNLIIQIFMKVAQGLWEVNKAGYVHCDIKPGNIMITPDNGVRIIDLGQACKIGTVKERVQGTPNFIAPEQARCKPLTEQTDVYNFGASFYWALTGRRVPTLLTVDKSDRRVVKDQDYPSPRELNPEIPQSLSDIVMRCLRLRASDRYTDMGMVLMYIEDCCAAMQKNK
jgi:serine/threonine-protein kinase